MKPRVCLLWVNGVVKEIHHFNLPSHDEVGFYRQTVSYNAFRERETNRYCKWIHEDKKKRPMPKYASLGEADTFTWWLEEFKNKPQNVFHHKSIWELYKAISYDYKKQKFIGSLK